MSTNLIRNYLDIINENSQPKIQLDEGMLDSIVQWAKSKAQKLASQLSPEEKESLTQMVTQASGGQPKFDLSTIKKVAAQFRPLAASIKNNLSKNQDTMNEGLKDFWNKYGSPISLAGGIASGYAGDKVGDMSIAVDKAAQAASPPVIINGQFDAMASMVQAMAAGNQASFNLDLLAFALGSLAVGLVVYSYLHAMNKKK